MTDALTPEGLARAFAKVRGEEVRPQTLIVPGWVVDDLEQQAADPKGYEVACGVEAFAIWACTDRGWPFVNVWWHDDPDAWDEQPAGFRYYEVWAPPSRYMDWDEYERRWAERTA